MENMQDNRQSHRPLHSFPDHRIYFITASTYLKKPLFNSQEKKRMLTEILRDRLELSGMRAVAYAVMDSHYHLLLVVEQDKRIPEFVRGVHGRSAFLLNRMDKSEGRRVWYNYWDSCVRKEMDFWVRFNYIHHNPVKHGLVDRMGDYAYSSYGVWVRKMGQEWVDDVWDRYPIVDFTKGDV
jgi:putative transposase